VHEVDGRVIFRAATRIALSVELHGKAVFVTRGFIVTDYDVAAGTSTQGSPYGVNSATRFDGLYYEEFLRKEAQELCGG
jgi:hypothetical protein